MRNLFKRAVFAMGFGTLVAGPAAAQGNIDNTAYGTTSAEFLLLGAGARGAALGGAFAALSTDITALYWNPAGLAQLERPGASFSTYDYIAETRYSWAGIAFPMSGGQAAFGIHGASFGFSEQLVYTVDLPEGDGTTYGVSETYIGATYARNFSDRFSAGITGKFISDELGRTSGRAVAFDFGTNFHAQLGPRPIRASFVIQNLGSTLRHDGAGLDVGVTRQPPTGQQGIPQEIAPARLRTKDFGLPVTFRIGLAFDFVSSASSRITLLSEFSQPNNSSATAGGGLEWALANLGNSGFSIAARGGYTHQPDNDIAPDATAAGFATRFGSDENKDGLALGGGIGFHRGGRGVSLDYAYRNLGVLGSTNFISATINW